MLSQQFSHQEKSARHYFITARLPIDFSSAKSMGSRCALPSFRGARCASPESIGPQPRWKNGFRARRSAAPRN